MKRLLLAFVFVMAILPVLRAQQDAQFTQFFLNRLNFNPAVAGSEEKICVLGAYRTQWVGFGNSTKGYSPTTFLTSINGPLGENLGLGLNIFSDKLGFEQSLSPTFSLSWRFHFGNGATLAPGVGVGFMQKSLDGGKLKWIDPGDPRIPTQLVKDNTIDFSAGIYYMQPTLSVLDKFYFGISSTHLNKGQISYSWTTPSAGGVDYELSNHYFIMTGAEYRISNTLAIDPNVIIKSDLTKTSVEVNSMLVYNEKFKGGLTYRSSNDISILIGYMFTEYAQLGYSYDITISNVGQYSNGSHEFVLKYCFMPKFNPPTPKPIVPILTPRFL